MTLARSEEAWRTDPAPSAAGARTTGLWRERSAAQLVCGQTAWDMRGSGRSRGPRNLRYTFRNYFVTTPFTEAILYDVCEAERIPRNERCISLGASASHLDGHCPGCRANLSLHADTIWTPVCGSLSAKVPSGMLPASVPIRSPDIDSSVPRLLG